MKKMLCVLMVCSAAVAENGGTTLSVLFKGLGRHHHPVTTQYKLAQRYFDQGLTLCFNFNHAEAIRSFESAAAIDPDCAMAWWGVAYAYGPNINAPMDDRAVAPAWEALQKALAAKSGVSRKEQDYIDALASRYAREPVKDRSALDQAYADAMRDLARKYPSDLDAQTLFAEALMDTSPWNYWQDGQSPKPSAKEAIETIESVLGRVKAHSGADHLYIHLVEAGPNPDAGVPSADRIGALTPHAGHLVHMASHIYLRVGRYHDAVKVNERAARVDEGYFRKSDLPGMYPGGYYPHNVHFLWYANDLEGHSRNAIEAARKVSEYTIDLRCGAIEGPRQRYLPLLAYARFGRWNDILASPEPASDLPFDRAMWHYARALAYTAASNVDRAGAEYARFKELKDSEAVRSMDNPYFPGSMILSVADHVLAGKTAGAQGRVEEEIEHLRRAVAAEDDIPYMEPPFWYYSVRESLGAALLRAGRSAEAEQVFREDLKELRENGRGLFGLAKSLRAQGRSTEARAVERRFKGAWRHADVDLSLAWF